VVAVGYRQRTAGVSAVLGIGECRLRVEAMSGRVARPRIGLRRAVTVDNAACLRLVLEPAKGREINRAEPVE